MRNGNTAPTNKCGSKEAAPVVPKIIIVTNGPDSMDVNTKAPASSLEPYCAINEAYKPPFVISIAVTIARVESPAKKPLSIIPEGINLTQRRPTTQATKILVTTIVPDFLNTTPVAFKSILAPIQKNHTERIGTVPVIKPFVKEPKYLPVHGAKVCKIAPNRRGTSIKPPGTRVTACIIFIVDFLPRNTATRCLMLVALE